MTLSILLIEDDLDLAQTIIDYLELVSIQCDHASNGLFGIELVEKNQFDVLLLDLNLPRMDGLSVCEHLRKDGNELPILMLTARDQLADKIAGFNVGTDDYLIKPFELDELVVRIQALSKRRSGQVQRLTFADLDMNLNTKTLTRQGKTLKLSPTCWQLLEVMLRSAPDIMSKAKLEQTVWGEDIPDSNSFKVHLHNLRKAVDSPFEKKLIHTVPGIGVGLKND